MKLSISRMHFPVRTLGPGARIGIWFQGCSIRCAGCISADTWTTGNGRTTLDEVMAVLSPWLRVAEGITVSGGEPFEQPDALHELLTRVRGMSAADVLVYSGKPIEALTERLRTSEGLIDALISDPFEMNTPQTMPLRGSDNQRLHLLTDLGRRRFATYERPLNASDRRLDLFFDEEGTVWMAGIPARGDLGRLTSILASEGHSASTSEAPTARRGGRS